LPLSSAGHLVVLHHLFGVREPTLVVDVALHIGTTVAVILACRRTLARWLTHERIMLGWLVLAMAPTVALGLTLQGAAARSTMSLRRVGCEFLVTAAWLALGHWLSRSNAERRTPHAERIDWWQALLIGAAQGIAVMPAISRSAATIGTALALGVQPVMAVEFSLLLSIPAVLGAVVFELVSEGNALSQQLTLTQLSAAFLITWLVGWLTIQWLRTLTVRRRLLPFAWYCGILGVALLWRG